VLEALARQDSPILDIVVVDNASTDNNRATLAEYARQHPDVPLRIVSCDRIGQPAALNAGIRATQGDVIVRMDMHAHPHPSYVRLAVCALQETGAGVVGGVWEIRPGSRRSIAEAIARAVCRSAPATPPIGCGPRRTGRASIPLLGCFLTHGAPGGFNEQVLTNEDYRVHLPRAQIGRGVMLDPEPGHLHRAGQSGWAVGASPIWMVEQMLARLPRFDGGRPCWWFVTAVVVSPVWRSRSAALGWLAGLLIAFAALLVGRGASAAGGDRGSVRRARSFATIPSWGGCWSTADHGAMASSSAPSRRAPGGCSPAWSAAPRAVRRHLQRSVCARCCRGRRDAGGGLDRARV
jgi:glycosyltransferase involved in cell wall biosynthesis